MYKPELLPTRGRVAAFTAGNVLPQAFPHKLLTVNIAMAAGTFHDQRLHPECGFAGRVIDDGMALQA